MTKLRFVILILALVASPNLGLTQVTTAIYNDQARGTFPVGSGSAKLSVLIPIQFGPVRVCSLPLTQAQPCLPLANITDVFGNPISNAIGGSFGQLTTDVVGRFAFGCTVLTNYQLQVAPAASNTPQLNYPITCPGSGASPTFNNIIATSLTASGTVQAAALVPVRGDRQIILANPDFEASTTILPPPGWVRNHGNETVTYETVTQAPNKRQSVKIATVDQNGGITSTLYPVFPGDTYSATAMAKADGTSNAVLFICWFNSASFNISCSSTGTASTSWTQLTLSATVPATAISASVVLLNVVATPSTVWFDQVSAQKTNFVATLKATANSDPLLLPTITGGGAGLIGQTLTALGSGTGKAYGVIGIARASGDVAGDKAYGGWFKAHAGVQPATEVALHAENDDNNSNIAEFFSAGNQIFNITSSTSTFNESGSQAPINIERTDAGNSYPEVGAAGNGAGAGWLICPLFGGTQTCWFMATNQNNGSKFELIPSTAVGGTTPSATSAFTIDSSGNETVTGRVNAGSGFQVNGQALSNHIVLGNGTAYVDSATLPVASVAPGTNGQCLITSAGVGAWGTCAGITAPQINTAAVNVSGNVSTPQNLQSVTFAAGVLNTAGKMWTFDVAGGNLAYVNTTETVTINIQINGANIALLQYVPNNTTGTSWSIHGTCVVTATGNPAQLACQSLGFAGTPPTAALTNIQPVAFLSGSYGNFTAAVTMQETITFGTASASNTANATLMTVVPNN